MIVHVSMAQYRDSTYFAKIPKYSRTYHVNIVGDIGTGFSHMNTGITSSYGDEVTLSAGGGFGIGLKAGYSMPSPSLDFSVAAIFQLSILNPPVNNITGLFHRIILEPAVRYVFELKKIKSSINVGAGADLAFNAKMDLDGSHVYMGAHNIYSYKNAVGPMGLVEYEFKIRRISLSAGLKYYSIHYKLESIESDKIKIPLQYVPSYILKEVDNINGSGLDLIFGFGFYF